MGTLKRIYHVGRVFKDTPYGNIFSAFVSEDDMALKNYFSSKDAFKAFMESGEATHTKSYEPGYKGFIFWNLSKNSPVLRMDGISYIPKELENQYTYDIHFKFLSNMLSKEGVDIQKAMNYTREKLLRDYVNGSIIPPLSLNYHLQNGRFTIKTNFEMMADPDSGDIILKIQNENTTDIEAYRELTDSVVLNMYDQIIYIDGTNDSVLNLSSIDGAPVYVQRTLTDSIEILCSLFQISFCPVGQFLDVIDSKTSNDVYGKIIKTGDDHIKFIRVKQLYQGLPKYIVTVADVSNSMYDFTKIL